MPPAATLPGKTIRQQKDVVKPLLMSPLTVGWPNIPNHLQVGVMAALPQLVPSAVADYHTDRARSSRAGKRARREQKRVDEAEAVVAEEAAVLDARRKRKEAKKGGKKAAGPPVPDVLSHFVIGLNETIKSLEHSIDDLRFRIAVLSDVLQHNAPTEEAEATPAPRSAPPSPLAMVLVFNGSVSPQALIDPLPLYAATFNTLLRQHAELAKAYIGAEGPEIRIVPLGSREAEGSALFGLRRVSVFAVRASHPELGVLERLLPPSVLQAPRHAITLPYPTTALKIYGGKLEVGDAEAAQAPKPKPKAPPSDVPTPAIYYAPVHLKGVLTEAPLDANARKQRRLTEVRRKRVESKEKRREANAKLEQKLRADFRAEGRTHPKIGRKERIAIKAGERAAKFAAKQEARDKAAAEKEAGEKGATEQRSKPQKEKRAGEPLVPKAKRAKAEAKAKAVWKVKTAAAAQ
ncbi:hypothetical protein VHUM_03515 [Vanrija humicola]|uniref:Uncharacterized protein n=1 Tax=Vanrija humicola TaxID=5417 RepID=A0A7D8YWU5_VANHU|nr:hypothetical protein VHUM_03515 [Vanrija humicola]